MSSSPANHLINEQSPYLLQHAHNPVQWYPWSAAALALAKSSDKPILLSIGYSTCHWCHVMAHESFEDDIIAGILNKHFISIKVDREERPDLDHIYMTAVTALTGQGGWPLTVFLTPDGKPFYGGTYFPPTAKWGTAGFTDVLEQVAQAWSHNRSELLKSADSLTGMLRQQALTPPSGDEAFVAADAIEHAWRHFLGQFDAERGGFGHAPKFPMGHTLSFLLRYQARTEQPQALSMVEKTLQAMAQGGIWDHIGFGFHRYSTDANWHVPHFEKMLYDQSLLARSYLEAYQVTGEVQYARMAEHIFTYVLRDMCDTQGGFYSAEDADSPVAEGGHNSEGAFYIFAESELTALLTPQEAQVFNYCYGVEPQGNAAFDPHGEFTGRNIFYLAHGPQEAADHFSLSIDDVSLRLEQSHLKIFQARAKRPRPHLDDKVLTDWNGLMIASLAFGGRVLGNDTYTQAARRAADFILTQLNRDGRLLHRWRKGNADITATLEDYAFFTYGLLELYEATFDETYLVKAMEMADTMITFFTDPDGQGFFMTASDAEALITRPKDAYDGALPSGNAVAASCLWRLYGLTEDPRYQDSFKGIVKAFAPSLKRSPPAHTVLLSAIDDEAHLTSITIEGAPDDSLVAKMLKVVYKYFMPAKVLTLRRGGITQAHVCRGRVCLPAVNDAAGLESILVNKRG